MYRTRIKIDLLVHDLKVPLSIIEAGVDSLLKREDKYGELTDKQKKVLNRVFRNTKASMLLVNDIMELSRSREGISNITDCQVRELVLESLAEVIDITGGDTSASIKSCGSLCDLSEILKERELYVHADDAFFESDIVVDRGKIKQILRNLISNALKYRKKRLDIFAAAERGHFVVTVQDDGKGIPEEYHKKIFDSFFQLGNDDPGLVRGHGLGLAGVLVLVTDMGGELFLKSGEDKGAAFTVKIPLA